MPWKSNVILILNHKKWEREKKKNSKNSKKNILKKIK
jgi:hypothetical protein